ncbi:hypothetical protein [Rhodoferax sp. TH121]|uniref:hypothetical protein n=1 Tax=Rhodoferax sp. TH121 TaxID=2022803 RepID=UPI0011406068|nr:hypothetical protein [Rhodoferax sp. TH121]
MKQIKGTGIHKNSGLKADFAAEYRLGLAGVSYSGVITVEGCPPSLQGGFMSWSRQSIPPGRAVERTVRESIQFLDVVKLLAMGKSK